MKEIYRDKVTGCVIYIEVTGNEIKLYVNDLTTDGKELQPLGYVLGSNALIFTRRTGAKR